ncbi:hypothetical protein H0H87_011124, partial [Tephrocybe sp. NHM501043]
MFLELNMVILNIKKIQIANTEATRKILKKYTKRMPFLTRGTGSQADILPYKSPQEAPA